MPHARRPPGRSHPAAGGHALRLRQRRHDVGLPQVRPLPNRCWEAEAAVAVVATVATAVATIADATTITITVTDADADVNMTNSQLMNTLSIS